MVYRHPAQRIAAVDGEDGPRDTQNKILGRTQRHIVKRQTEKSLEHASRWIRGQTEFIQMV